VGVVSDMRFCNKCFALFFDGDAFKGACPADGRGHVSQGFMFMLSFDLPETPNTQSAWQQCGKCQAIFFDGFPDKGHCDAGGAHQANRRFPFLIPHDIPGDENAQQGWEFCTKCNVMYFDGFDSKGHCAAGGGHQRNPGAFHFVLTHDIHPGQPIDEGSEGVAVDG
jgi:hypothetical protein